MTATARATPYGCGSCARRETDTAGLKVATIVEASPYWAGGNDVPNHGVDLDEDGLPAKRRRAAGKPGLTGPAVAYSGYYDNYFLPRGYAVTQVDSLGTGGSTGCPTSGGRNETLGAKAAIDWLNGRARAGTSTAVPSRPAGSTGNAAMMGISYNGTLPTAVASTESRASRRSVADLRDLLLVRLLPCERRRRRPRHVPGRGHRRALAKYVYSRADREVCSPS